MSEKKEYPIPVEMEPVSTSSGIRTPNAAKKEFLCPLPSEGKLYEGSEGAAQGSVILRPMTISEESILAQQGGDSLSKISAIINACTVSKEYPIDDLLMIDRFAILLALRTRSFGGKYKFPFRCQFCGGQFKTEIDIMEELHAKVTDPDGAGEPFQVNFPISNDLVTFRLLRGKDEMAVAKSVKRFKLQSSDAGDPSNIMRMSKQILTVNGEELQGVRKDQYIRNLDSGDSNAFRLAVERAEGGIDTNILIDCRMCGASNETSMPFDIEFFRPSSL